MQESHGAEGQGSWAQHPGSPLSESLLSEQSVRVALLSGSSGLPHCFLFFFLVWVRRGNRGQGKQLQALPFSVTDQEGPPFTHPEVSRGPGLPGPPHLLHAICKPKAKAGATWEGAPPRMPWNMPCSGMMFWEKREGSRGGTRHALAPGPPWGSSHMRP